uniref:Uncharacterized protein n=1 Tax=Chaetoceros debilis TaxID=122233 RepID=A0A7S3V5Y9_9STRA
MKLRRKIILVSAVLTGAPSLVLSRRCKVDARTECVITDPSAEFAKYNGLSCKELEYNYKIDMQKVMEKTYSGKINDNGYPQINVRYEWEMCNMNKRSNEKVELNRRKTFARLGDADQPIIVTGKIDQGDCRTYELSTSINTEDRYHTSLTQMKGLLLVEGKRKKRKCLDYMYSSTRLQYSDDCDITANIKCNLWDAHEGDVTLNPCKGNIDYDVNGECYEVPVVYEWEVCNNENQSINVDQPESIYKLNNRDIGKIDSPLKPKHCANYKKLTFIDSCRKWRRQSSIFVLGLDDTERKCRVNAFLEL